MPSFFKDAVAHGEVITINKRRARCPDCVGREVPHARPSFVGRVGDHLGPRHADGGVRVQAPARLRGESSPSGSRLWSSAVLAGLFFVVAQAILGGVSWAAGAYLDFNPATVFWVTWLVVYAPLAVVFLVWVFDLDNLLQGLSVFVLYLILPVVIQWLLGFVVDWLR
jgi:hypothetical protein